METVTDVIACYEEEIKHRKTFLKRIEDDMFVKFTNDEILDIHYFFGFYYFNVVKNGEDSLKKNRVNAIKKMKELIIDAEAVLNQLQCDILKYHLPNLKM